MSGPKSVSSFSGNPTLIFLVAPINICIVFSYTSFCMANILKAEQRCPAELKADSITSSTTCSVSADESTIIKF